MFTIEQGSVAQYQGVLSRSPDTSETQVIAKFFPYSASTCGRGNTKFFLCWWNTEKKSSFVKSYNQHTQTHQHTHTHTHARSQPTEQSNNEQKTTIRKHKWCVGEHKALWWWWKNEKKTAPKSTKMWCKKKWKYLQRFETITPRANLSAVAKTAAYLQTKEMKSVPPCRCNSVSVGEKSTGDLSLQQRCIFPPSADHLHRKPSWRCVVYFCWTNI